ncbi:MAG: hypothetical protein II547_10345 [Treponema sp.]|nr:hypothetical protein [Treponema sp.]
MSDAALADFNKLTDDLLAEREEIREQMRNGTLQTYSTMEEYKCAMVNQDCKGVIVPKAPPF